MRLFQIVLRINAIQYNFNSSGRTGSKIPANTEMHTIIEISNPITRSPTYAIHMYVRSRYLGLVLVTLNISQWQSIQDNNYFYYISNEYVSEIRINIAVYTTPRISAHFSPWIKDRKVIPTVFLVCSKRVLIILRQFR